MLIGRSLPFLLARPDEGRHADSGRYGGGPKLLAGSFVWPRRHSALAPWHLRRRRCRWRSGSGLPTGRPGARRGAASGLP